MGIIYIYEASVVLNLFKIDFFLFGLTFAVAVRLLSLRCVLLYCFVVCCVAYLYPSAL
jgi:hypothetical protein